MKKIAVRREAAQASVCPLGTRRFLLQAARRVERLRGRALKLRRELRAVRDELRMARKQMRDVLETLDTELDTPLPTDDKG